MCVPNAFMQTWLDTREGDKEVVVKITGVLVDVSVNNNPDLHKGFVVHENGQKAVHTEALKAIHGMLVGAVLWHKQFGSNLEAEDFTFNPCNP